MELKIKVIPCAKKNLIKPESGALKVYLTASPVEGKANKALIEFLAKEYGISKSKVTIIKGLKSRNKKVNIDITKN